MKKIENEIIKGGIGVPKPSSDSFRVPEGFFEDLPEQIISGRSRNINDNSKVRFNRISIAAVISILALSASLIYQQAKKYQTNSEPSADDFAHFLVLEGTSNEELAQLLIPDQIDGLSDESQNENIYETYLLEQEIDINHINEEL